MFRRSDAILIVYAEGQDRIDRMEASGGVTLVNGDEAAEDEASVRGIACRNLEVRSMAVKRNLCP